MLRDFRVLRGECFLLLAFLLAGTACNRAAELAPGPIQIELVTGASTSDAVVRVTGLSSTELRAVSGARLDAAAWQSLLRVTVSDSDAATVAGRYAATASALEYRPRYPFDSGRSYTVRFDPARLPAPRSEPAVTARVRVAGAVAQAAPTAVTRIYPSADIWPENMLRFYIHFSAPMSRGSGTQYVHLVSRAGKKISDAILAAYGDLWNDDTTRLTVFFDPGRVKRGVGPNVAMGRAIVEGNRYAIKVDAEWKDAQGRPLVAGFLRDFTAGPAAYHALSTDDWIIEPPRAGGLAHLLVTFQAPLDHALLQRTIGVQTASGQAVEGSLDVGPAEKSWTFVPKTAWRTGAYRLIVQTLLEDPAGNRIGRAFEVLMTDPGAQPAEQDIVYLPFDIR